MISNWLDVIPEQGGQYDAWDETINPPRLWHCRDCNGMGYNPYTWPCQACKETGIRWAWLRGLYEFMKFIQSVQIPRFLYLANRCSCGKIHRFLGFGVGKHDDCLPF